MQMGVQSARNRKKPLAPAAAGSVNVCKRLVPASGPNYKDTLQTPMPGSQNSWIGKTVESLRPADRVRHDVVPTEHRRGW